MTKPWVLLLIFKLGWFGLVLFPVYAVWVVPLVLLLLLVKMPAEKRLAWLAFSVIGMALDATLIAMGYLETSHPLPLWLALLWGWFMWAWLCVFSQWLAQRWQVLLFFAIGGPLAYRGGALIGDQLGYPNDLQFLAWHGVCWLVLGGLLYEWQQRRQYE